MTIVYDGTVSWANSAAAGTVKTVDIDLPNSVSEKYEVIVTNPSAETALSISVKNEESFGTTVKYPEISALSVPVSTPDGKANLVEGFFLGEGGRITLSNDTALGLSGAFTAEVRVRKV